MQKLRRVVLDKMINAGLTGLQVDMMLYLSQYQDEYGRITGVYYRAVCKETGMSIQSFYNVLRFLEQKQLISMEKNSSSDWDIVIKDNDCHDFGRRRSEIGQYINTNQHMLFSKSFRSLPGGAKLLAMFLLRRCGENSRKNAAGFRQKPEGFYQSLVELLHVSRRVILSYLKKLEPFFSLGIMTDEHSGSRLYCVRPKTAGLLKSSSKSEEQKEAEHRIRAFCRRQKLDPDMDGAVEDTAKLAHQYRQAGMELLQEAILTATQLNKACRKLPGAALTHRVLRGLLGLDKPLRPAVID